MWDHSPLEVAETKGGHRLGNTSALVGCFVLGCFIFYIDEQPSFVFFFFTVARQIELSVLLHSGAVLRSVRELTTL